MSNPHSGTFHSGTPNVTASVVTTKTLSTFSLSLAAATPLHDAATPGAVAGSMSRHVGALDHGMGLPTVPGQPDVVVVSHTADATSAAAFASTGHAVGAEWKHGLPLGATTAPLVVMADDGSHTAALMHSPVSGARLSVFNASGTAFTVNVTAALGLDVSAVPTDMSAARSARFVAVALSSACNSSAGGVCFTTLAVFDTVAGLGQVKGDILSVAGASSVSICPMGVFVLHADDAGHGVVRRWNATANAYTVRDVVVPSVAATPGRLLNAAASVNGEHMNVDGCWTLMCFDADNGTAVELAAVSMLTQQRYFMQLHTVSTDVSGSCATAVHLQYGAVVAGGDVFATSLYAPSAPLWSHHVSGASTAPSVSVAAETDVLPPLQQHVTAVRPDRVFVAAMSGSAAVVAALQAPAASM